MAINPAILQQIGVRDNAQALNIFQNALVSGQQRKRLDAQESRRAELQPFQVQQAQQQQQLGEQQGQQNRRNQILQSINDFAVSNASLIQNAQQSGDPTQLRAALVQRQQQLTQQGLPTDQTVEALSLIDSGQMGQVISGLGDAVNLFNQGRGQGRSAGQREHENLVRIVEDPNSTQIQRDSANRALGNLAKVGTSAAERIAESPEKTQLVADSKAKIRQAEKFGELTASSRSKAIDKGFDQITKIDLGLSNIDDAIQAVTDGAGTGFIEKNFPSIKAASVLLDNIQGRMALDVIGAVTFGALSKGELDLAKMIALPTGLEGPELIKHLQDKKAAQQKLRNYYGEQIEFLDQGGSVAGFLRSKKREQSSATQATDTPEVAQAQPQISEGQTATGPNGEKAVFTNGQWVVQ